MAVKSLSHSSILQPATTNSMLGDYESNYFHHLETVRLGGATTSVTFSNLAQYSDYQHLQLRIATRTNRTGADSDPVVMRFNSDNGANYATHGIIGYNFGGTTAVASNGGTSTNHLFLTEAMPVSSSGANSFGAMVVDILDPYETIKNKTVRTLAGMKDAWSSVEIRSGVWLSTASLTSLTILPLLGSQLTANSRFSLYGIKARS